MEQPLPGSDSTKAMGAIAPDSHFQLPDGTIVYAFLFCFTLVRNLFLHDFPHAI